MSPITVSPPLNKVSPSTTSVEEAAIIFETWNGAEIVLEALEMKPPPNVRSPVAISSASERRKLVA